jgi:hypothetical protein
LIGRRLFAAATIASTAAPALADVPFATDDPFLIEPGHYEIALGIDRLALPGRDATLASATYDLGVADGAQIGVAALSMHAGRFTLGELAVNAKFALVPAREGRFGLAFRPALAMPLGDSIRNRAGAVLPLYAGAAKGEWSLYGGAGYALNSRRDGGSYPFAGIVASRALGERWTAGMEIDARAASQHSPGFVELGAGASVALGRNFTLAGAFYRTLANRGANGDGRAFLTLRYAH